MTQKIEVQKCWMCGRNAQPGRDICRDDAYASDPWTFHRASRAAQRRAIHGVKVEPFKGQPWGQPRGEL